MTPEQKARNDAKRQFRKNPLCNRATTYRGGNYYVFTRSPTGPRLVQRYGDTSPDKPDRYQGPN